MYQFWYHYIKPKYGKKGNLCYMDTDSFIVWKNENEKIEKIITKFVGLRAKIYSYLIDVGSEDNKAKGKIKCVIKIKQVFRSNSNWR